MKTLHIIPNISRKMGGSAYAVNNILMLEKTAGIEGTVLCIIAEEPDSRLTEYATVEVLAPSFPARFSRSKNAIKWLHKNAVNYDIVIIHTIWAALPIEAAHVLRKLKVPFVIWPHGGLDPFDLQKKKNFKKILGPIFVKPMLEKCEAIICTAEKEAEVLEVYGSKSKKMILPLPVLKSQASGNRERFRDRFSIGSEDFVLIFLSLLYYKKGLNLLIPAVKELSKMYSNLKVVIAGSELNGYGKIVNKLIEEHQLENKVIVTGFLSGQDKYDAFAGSDCFVLPSMNENFGIAIVEALNAGLPVLISKNVYIWKEIIQNGGGWVCEYSIESVTESIKGVLDNNDEYSEKKKNAAEVAKIFSPESLKNNYMKVYQEIIDNYGY